MHFYVILAALTAFIILGLRCTSLSFWLRSPRSWAEYACDSSKLVMKTLTAQLNYKVRERLQKTDCFVEVKWLCLQILCTSSLRVREQQRSIVNAWIWNKDMNSQDSKNCAQVIRWIHSSREYLTSSLKTAVGHWRRAGKSLQLSANAWNVRHGLFKKISNKVPRPWVGPPLW